MKNTKRSIIISAILAIMMCASLIVGGTLALFTSNSKVNIAVTSGNVEVVATAEITELSHVDEDGQTVTGRLFSGDAKFEGNTLTISNMLPKDTVKFNINVQNNSNVTVKYRTVLTVEEDNGLVSWLDIDLNGYKFAGNKAATKYKTLAKDADGLIETIPVAVALPESATCNNTMCKLSVTVEAVQGNASVTDGLTATAEETVVAETVNGTIWYSLIDSSSLLAAVADGKALAGDVTMKEDVDLPLPVYANEGDVTINAEGKTIENTADIWDKVLNAWSLVSARKTANLTLNGGNYQAKENDCYAVDVQDGATLTITSGTFNGNIHAVYVQKGTAYIEGGFFAVQQKYPQAGKENEFVLNCYDANRANGTAKIIVTGGTFVNFNPADNYAEGEHTNFVADGYTVVATRQANGDVWYTVVEENANGLAFTDGEHVLNKNVTVGAANGIAVKASGANTKLTIEDGFYNGGANGNNKGIYVTDGATVTIKNGTFTVGSDAEGTGNSVVETNGGNVIIEGGFFYTDFKWNGFYYVLNQKNNNPGTITVKGGTFVNYDPSKGDDNLKGNFVADGYKVKAEAHGEDTWYIVTPAVEAGEDGKISASDVADVIASANTDNKVTVVLPEGTVKLKGTTPAVANKDITFVGNGENTVYDNTPTTAGGESKADYSLENAASVTFRNMTINLGNADHNGFIRAKNLYFENCKIIGRGSYWGVGKVVFKNCEFTAIGDYCLWLYSGSSYSFENCTFNSDIGKFVNAYIEQAQAESIIEVDFKNCTFNGKDENKPAVCLKSNASAAWRLSFSGCTLNGLAKDSATGSNYYSVETGYQATTTVTIDGTLVWENGLKNA